MPRPTNRTPRLTRYISDESLREATDEQLLQPVDPAALSLRAFEWPQPQRPTSNEDRLYRRLSDLENRLADALAADDQELVDDLRDSYRETEEELRSWRDQEPPRRRANVSTITGSTEFWDFPINGQKTQIALRSRNGVTFTFDTQTNRGTYHWSVMDVMVSSVGLVFRRRPANRMTNGMKLVIRKHDGRCIALERKEISQQLELLNADSR